jgi:hypothetical protein
MNYSFALLAQSDDEADDEDGDDSHYGSVWECQDAAELQLESVWKVHETTV